MKTTDVFGVSNDEIASYIEREEVDAKFIEGLQRNKHIIVFGASKQGKTALTIKHLAEKDFIRVNCSPQSLPIDIYSSVLRQLGVEFQEERTETTTTEATIKASIKAAVKIPFFGSGETECGAEGKGGKEKEVKYKTVEYNLSLPQDISEILKAVNFTKRIVLENFHYLDEEVQKEMAFHLRVFEDFNILFIVLGIWREKNRLAQFNGDLQDRLIEVPVEPWRREDFIKVIEKGSDLIQVKFDDIVDTIIENSFDSIGVFQELCKETCLAAGITESRITTYKLSQTHCETAISRKLDDYSGRHIRSIETFVEQKVKSSEEVPLYISYYFINYLFSLDFRSIEAGIKRSDIHDGIKALHHRPDDVRASDLSYFLHNLTSSQIKKSILPPLFDYDRSTRKLKIIDSTLYFFLRNANRDEIMEELDTPSGI